MSGVDTNLIAGRLAARVGYSKPSVRTQLLDRAGKLADVIFLGRGDPDLDTPKHVVEAAKTALDNGATHYTLAGGRAGSAQGHYREVDAGQSAIL